MEALIEYREHLIRRLEQSAREFCIACKNRSPQDRTDGDWTVHQIAAHVRDVDRAVYGVRVHRTLQEENPLFESFDADAWMAEHYDAAESLQTILQEIQTGMDGLCTTLKDLPPQAWSRVSRHATMGEDLTLQSWVERSLAHIEEHLETLKKST